MRPRMMVLSPLVFLSLLTGCAHRHPPTTQVQRLDRPYLLHLPGIGGDNFIHQWYLNALVEGGFDAETEIYDWTEGRFALNALQDIETNKVEAHAIAERLAQLHRTSPARPIYLSAESGGAGMALWVLEALPQDVTIDAVVLLAPAVSPQYDLSAALARVGSSMLVVSSKRDQVILNAGTNMFGTMDRKYETSAGVVGFQPPPTADLVQYAKLRPYRYDSTWFWTYGHWGGHLSAINARFARQFLAPLLASIAREGHGVEWSEPPEF